MSWTSSVPQDRWKEVELFSFLRELFVRGRCFGSFAWNPANVPANSTVDTTLTTVIAPQLKGLRVGMAIVVTPPATINSGLVCAGAWVAADDTITIRLANITGSGIDLAEGTWAFMGKIV